MLSSARQHNLLQDQNLWERFCFEFSTALEINEKDAVVIAARDQNFVERTLARIRHNDTGRFNTSASSIKEMFYALKDILSTRDFFSFEAINFLKAFFIMMGRDYHIINHLLDSKGNIISDDEYRLLQTRWAYSKGVTLEQMSHLHNAYCSLCMVLICEVPKLDRLDTFNHLSSNENQNYVIAVLKAFMKKHPGYTNDRKDLRVHLQFFNDNTDVHYPLELHPKAYRTLSMWGKLKQRQTDDVAALNNSQITRSSPQLR